MMKRTLFMAALALSGCISISAQDLPSTWTLEQCISYAIENNIDLKQKTQDLESRKVDLSTSRNSWLPNVSANVGQNLDFGRSPSKTGVIVDQNSTSSSAYLQMSMPLFDGLKTQNDIAAKKLNLMASIETLNKAKEDLSVNVASYYLQVLYNKELQKISEMQVALDSDQVSKTELMVKAGKVPTSQLYDIKAQLATDQSSLTDSRNNVKLATLDLAQSLELERKGIAFDVTAPSIEDPVSTYLSSILPPDQIYNNAVQVKPQIKVQEYMLESQKKQLKIAKAGYLPKLDLSAYYSNGYYHYSGTDAVNASFSDQLKQNERKSIGLTLSIPIFDHYTTRNSVRSAQINIRNQELAIENSKKSLYKEIQQAYYNATAAQDKYIATGKSVEASATAFSYAKDKYSAGKSTVFEFNEAKTKYSKSLAEQAQAKYNFIFRAKILDFYNGTPLKL